MALDVVVVNYKTPDLLQGFKDSYFKHYWKECTITTVQVESGQQGFSRSERTMFFEDNVGYGHACNWGARFGYNDVILLANADTVLSEQLQECHDALMAHDDWGILGPRQVNENNQITAGGIFSRDGTPRTPYQNAWNQRDDGQCSAVRDDALFVSGSLLFVKRNLWEEMTKCEYWQALYPDIHGAFLPTRHYFEDTWCGYHARGHGYKCVFYGPAKMIHYWHRAHSHGSSQDHEVERSKAMYREACVKHGIIHE